MEEEFFDKEEDHSYDQAAATHYDEGQIARPVHEPENDTDHQHA